MHYGLNQWVDNTSRNIENSESTLGLVKQSDADETVRWKQKMGIGVRFRSGLDPYVRYTATRRLALGASRWQMNSFNRLSYYNKNGFQACSNLDFTRPITEQISFRALTQLDWQQHRSTSYIQSLEVNYIRDQRNAFRTAGLFIGDTDQSPTFLDKVLQFYWRRDIHKRFIFLDIVPEYHWPGSNQENPYASLTLRLEFVFQADFAAQK